MRKFITVISDNLNLENAEYLTTDKKVKAEDNEYTRAPQVDTSKLKTGDANTAIYNHTKEAVSVRKNDYVIYTIRVYNEGEADVYASKITDHLPTYLDYVDCKFNQDFGWVVEKDGKTVSTNYLSSEKETATNKTVLKAFDNVNDDGKGSGVSFRDVQILARVNDKARTNQNITNIAQVSEYQGEDGRWTIIEIIERPKYGPAYNLKNNKGARLTLPLSQVDNDPNKYKLYNPNN